MLASPRVRTQRCQGRTRTLVRHSCSVEKHVNNLRDEALGVSRNQSKKAGSNVQCDNVGPLVFQACLQKAVDRFRAEASSRCFSDAATKSHFFHCLNDCLGARTVDRRREVANTSGGKKKSKSLSFDSKLDRTKTRGYDIFCQNELRLQCRWRAHI